MRPVCKDLGKVMRLRKGKYGNFWACTGHPLPIIKTLCLFEYPLHEKKTSCANRRARLLTVISLLVDPSLRSILFYFCL